MKFEWYVLNYDCNAHKVEQYNIFRNIHVQEWTEKAVKKYLRAPSKYKYIVQYANPYLDKEEIAIYGFDALVREIRGILQNQLWSRREYEISVSDAFVYEVRDLAANLGEYDTLDALKTDLLNRVDRIPKLEKWDCFKQCEPNLVAITHEVIRQYKEQIKESD